MILRRFMKHVSDQNWFAVGLDVLVVITGIFLGMQVTDWNEDRANHAKYLQALNRLEGEIADNLAIISEERQIINDELAIVRSSLDALITCSNDPSAIAVVNNSIERASGTRGIHARTTELTALTSNPALLAKQSDQIRARLAELRFFLQLAKEISVRFEPQTNATSPMGNQTLTFQSAETKERTYFGLEYETLRYPMVLNVPMQEACKDIHLQKWLHTWEKWTSNTVIFNQKLRREFEKTLTVLRGIAK